MFFKAAEAFNMADITERCFHSDKKVILCRHAKYC